MKAYLRSSMGFGMLFAGCVLAGCSDGGPSSAPATADEQQKQMDADMENMSKMIPQEMPTEPAGGSGAPAEAK